MSKTYEKQHREPEALNKHRSKIEKRGGKIISDDHYLLVYNFPYSSNMGRKKTKKRK